MFGFNKWKEERLTVERRACGLIAQHGKDAVEFAQAWHAESARLGVSHYDQEHARKVAVRVKQLVESGDA